MIKDEDKNQIRDLIKEYFVENGGTTGASATSLHRHTGGGDGLQIESSNLLPYQIITALDSGTINTGYNNPLPNGSIKLYDYSSSVFIPGTPDLTIYDWGMSVFLGNNGVDGSGNPIPIWSDVHMADFWLGVSQVTPQTIAPAANATIIFDGLPDDGWFPTGAYNNTTGLFSTILNSKGQKQVYGGWNSQLSYMVSASVGLASVNGTVVPGESADINVYVDGNLMFWNRVYFPSATDPVIATISLPMFVKIEDEIHIEVTNNTSDTLTTNIAGISQITYFTIKQFK